MFSSILLREGKASYDNISVSRIIVGEKSTRAKKNIYAQIKELNTQEIIEGVGYTLELVHSTITHLLVMRRNTKVVKDKVYTRDLYSRD